MSVVKENQMFGNWKVLGESERNKTLKNNRYYKCRCSCGVEKDVRLESLTNGFSTSCGCRRQKRRKELNTGAEFGSWQIVDSKLNSLKNDMYYYLECRQCEERIEGYHLELYKLMKKTCSCNLGPQGFKKGTRYGNWVIQCPGKKSSNKAGDKYYLCKCDCGTLREVVDSSLRKLLSTSCGCSRVNSQKKVISVLGRFNPSDFQGDIYGKWKVSRRDIVNNKKIYECMTCGIKFEVKLEATQKKCQICSHPKDIDTIKLMKRLCEKHNFLYKEELYFIVLKINDSGTMKYTLTDGLKVYDSELVLSRKRRGHPLKNSPLISSDVSKIIDELKLDYDERFIVEHKNDLHPLLINLESWDLTRILLQGYYIDDSFYI
ncbi:hypothetical protein ACOMCU_22370 [Lysinibacillus sp. UGB7]|uniref:hypothetical protein n=1 Tax=Lysinibacillus sp. UGB7 TaxID=3411039 RepID=UPI003B7EEB28